MHIHSASRRGGASVYSLIPSGSMHGGRMIEAFCHASDDQVTICLSTQNGCAGGCTFCGASSRVRQLSTEDILAQFDLVTAAEGIDPMRVNLSIEFIVLGEPMHNFDSVDMAVRAFHARYPHAKIVFCTIMPEVRDHRYRGLVALLNDVTQMELHVSLHRTTDTQRDQLITLRRKMRLAQIAEFAQSLVACQSRAQLVFNYPVEDGGNDRGEDLVRLFQLFPPSIWRAKISVLCMEGQDEQTRLARAANLEATRVWDAALRDVGYVTRLHNPSGQDIGAGSGILTNQNATRV